MNKHRALAVAGVSVFGALTSVYALWQHYAPPGSAVCNFGATLSCDIVNQSAYAEIAGVPVALIGIVGYLALLGLALSLAYGWIAQLPRLALLRLGVGFGLLFSLYLTAIEEFVLGSYCPICLLSLCAITLIAGLTFLPQPRQDLPV